MIVWLGAYARAAHPKHATALPIDEVKCHFRRSLGVPSEAPHRPPDEVWVIDELVIGADVGGLACATYLARRDFAVTIVEASSFAGGLAASFDIDGLRFDGGPYILLDKPGHSWAGP